MAKKTDNTMKTKSIRTNKRGRLRISAKTSEKWFERMNRTQTSEETEVTNTERETEERIPTRCSHVVKMVEHIRHCDNHVIIIFLKILKKRLKRYVMLWMIK